MQKKLRLTNNQDFNKVYRHGRSTANLQFVVYYRGNHAIEQFRLGVSVSKKIGNAVVRNRMRRMVKEIVRRHQQEITPHHDFILIVRKPALLMDYSELEKSILHILKKAQLIQRKRERQSANG